MKGSPGGILLIAIGVVLLQIAATGRFRQVWAALSTGAAPADTAPSGIDPTKEYDVPISGQEPPDATTDDNGNVWSVGVTVVSSGQSGMVPEDALSATIADGGGSGCGSGQVMVISKRDKVRYCVNPTVITKSSDSIPTKYSSSQGGDVPLITMQTATGKMMYVNRTRTRGLMNVSSNAAI